IPIVVLPFLLSVLRVVRDPLWVARRIERRYPDLDARLLAALEQHPGEKQASLGFLQETVVLEALEHASRHRWQGLVSVTSLKAAQWAQWAMGVAFAVVMLSLAIEMGRHPRPGGAWAALVG